MMLATPALLVATDGTVYVNANALNLSERHGRRVMRVLALTPRESKGIAAMLTSFAPELFVGVAAQQDASPPPSEGKCPMSATALVCLRFSADMVARLDATAREVGARLGRRIPRSEVIRAIVHLLGDRLAVEDVPGLEGLFALDRVRRGRAPRPGGAS